MQVFKYALVFAICFALLDPTDGGWVRRTWNKIKDRGCKVSNVEVVYPFSDVFPDYDINGDKEITYDEFAISVMTSVNLAHPEELMEPFLWSDVDDPNYTTYDDNATSAAA